MWVLIGCDNFIRWESGRPWFSFSGGRESLERRRLPSLSWVGFSTSFYLLLSRADAPPPHPPTHVLPMGTAPIVGVVNGGSLHNNGSGPRVAASHFRAHQSSLLTLINPEWGVGGGGGVNLQGAEALMGFSDNKQINKDFPFLRYIPFVSGEIIYFGLTGKTVSSVHAWTQMRRGGG